MAFHILVNSLFGGGAELQAALLASALKPASFMLLDGETSPRAGEAPAHTALKPASALPGALRTLMLGGYARRLAGRVKAGDTVLSFMQRSNFVNVLAARKSGHRAVICEVTQPSGEYTGLRGLLVKPLIRRLYPQAALTLANSRGNASDLERNFGFRPGSVKVINNSCDLAALRAKTAEAPGPAWERVFSRPVVITTGRLTTAKGQWHLIKAFARLKRSVPQAALVILGDGELKLKLHDLTAYLGLKPYLWTDAAEPAGDEDVFLAGFQANPYKFLARAKVFAFPSLWEGLPNAIIEALACGLPVVSADCASGPRELLAPDTDFSARAAAPEVVPAGVLLPPFPLSAMGRKDLELIPLEESWALSLAGLLQDPGRLDDARRAAHDRAEDFSLQTKLPEWQAALGL